MTKVDDMLDHQSHRMAGHDRAMIEPMLEDTDRPSWLSGVTFCLFHRSPRRCLRQWSQGLILCVDLRFWDSSRPIIHADAPLEE